MMYANVIQFYESKYAGTPLQTMPLSNFCMYLCHFGLSTKILKEILFIYGHVMNSLDTAELLWASRLYDRRREYGCIIQPKGRKSEKKQILTKKDQQQRFFGSF